MSQEVTNSEILGAIHAFSESVDKRFDRIESTMATKNQVNILIDVLHENKVITSFEAKTVKSIA